MAANDDALARRAETGDSRAFRALVDRYYADCLRYACRMLGERADAEDAVQETFVRVYRSLPRYRAEGKFRSWLYVILVNRCRSAAGRKSREGAAWLEPDAAAEATEREDEGLGRRIAAALLELHPDHREAFLLRYVDEMGYEEMAEVTGAGVSALKMRVSRARQRLRDMLKDLDEGA